MREIWEKYETFLRFPEKGNKKCWARVFFYLLIVLALRNMGPIEIYFKKYEEIYGRNMKLAERQIPVDIKSRGQIKGKLLPIEIEIETNMDLK